MITSTSIDTDLCVVGGGLAGVCAALAAARNGIRVVLVQDRSVLGGNASSEIKMHVVGADCHGSRPGARETGLLEELRLEDAFRNPGRCYPMWDVLLYEKVKQEENITLLLDSDCAGCECETDAAGRPRICSVRVVRNVTEEEFVVTARHFADCSGDGRLGAEAGAEYMAGRESQADYGESLAMPEADGQTLGNSILFTARDLGSPQTFIAPSWVRRFKKSEFKFRPVRGYEYGYWWSEWGGHLHTIKDYDTIRHELLRVVLGIWDYIKNSGDHPDAANYALEWFGAIPGKRESRRFYGPHVLVQDDIMGGRTFDDQVAYGGWWLDLHPPTGIDAVEERPCIQHHIPHLFGIPLRALYSRTVANLFFAGRNVSATHVAFASTRVMGTTAVMGQAVGTASARLLRAGGGGRSIQETATPAAVRDIQQTLLRDDAFLLGVTNEDARDLARRATCRASEANEDGAAGRVVAGQTRDVATAWGPWAENAGGESNGWTATQLPAWIELEWPTAAPVQEIHLTFDSGLQRELLLTPSDALTSKVVRGPQPELVRDYDVLLDDERVISVRGNYLRKRVHRLVAPIAVNRLRLEVLATHGAPAARVFEVRAYGKA